MSSLLRLGRLEHLEVESGNRREALEERTVAVVGVDGEPDAGHRIPPHKRWC